MTPDDTARAVLAAWDNHADRQFRSASDVSVIRALLAENERLRAAAQQAAPEPTDAEVGVARNAYWSTPLRVRGGSEGIRNALRAAAAHRTQEGHEE